MYDFKNTLEVYYFITSYLTPYYFHIRFPATSPLKTFPQRHTEIKKTNTEYFSKDKDGIFKLRNLSQKTSKKRGLHFSQENTEKINHERITNEDLEIAPDNQEISQEDVEEVWRYVIMI